MRLLAYAEGILRNMLLSYNEAKKKLKIILLIAIFNFKHHVSESSSRSRSEAYPVGEVFVAG